MRPRAHDVPAAAHLCAQLACRTVPPLGLRLLALALAQTLAAGQNRRRARRCALARPARHDLGERARKGRRLVAGRARGGAAGFQTLTGGTQRGVVAVAAACRSLAAAAQAGGVCFGSIGACACTGAGSGCALILRVAQVVAAVAAVAACRVEREMCLVFEAPAC